MNAAARELEPVRDLLLIARDRERAEVRCQDETHRVRDAVVDHFAHDVLDPRRPVPHPEVAAEPTPELGREHIDLTLRYGEQWRGPADRAVVLGDLLDNGTRGRPAVADVRQVAGDLLERRGPAVGHDEDADHADVRSRTCSTNRRTLSSGVCGVSPWPTLKTCPGRPSARPSTSSMRNCSSRQGASSDTG